MKNSLLSESIICINDDSVDTDQESSAKNQMKIVTLDEGYEMTHGNGRYQLLIYITGFITFSCSMWYVYCIPFFFVFPKVYGCKDGLCKSAKEACLSSSYYYEDPKFNFITEMDLLCNDMAGSLIASAFPMGFIIGNMLLSSASDFFGRIPILLIGQFGMGLSILIIFFFPTYQICLVCTAACGFFSVASFFPTYSLLYGANHSNRVKACAAFLAISAGIAELMVVLIMWLNIRWRTMCIIFMVFCMSFSIFPILLNESPRFFYAKGQHDFAAKIFRFIGNVNGVKLDVAIRIEDNGKNAEIGRAHV